MNLDTGKRIHGYRFTELSMPDHVIEQVHTLANAEHAPDLDEDGCPIFEWELGTPIVPPSDLPPPNEPMPLPTTLDTETVASASSLVDDDLDDTSLHDPEADDDSSISDVSTPFPSAAPTVPTSIDASRSDMPNDDDDPSIHEARSDEENRSDDEVRSEPGSESADDSSEDTEDSDETRIQFIRAPRRSRKQRWTSYTHSS